MSLKTIEHDGVEKFNGPSEIVLVPEASQFGKSSSPSLPSLILENQDLSHADSVLPPSYSPGSFIPSPLVE